MEKEELGAVVVTELTQEVAGDCAPGIGVPDHVGGYKHHPTGLIRQFMQLSSIS